VDSPLFIAAQFASALAATLLFRKLIPSLPQAAQNILMPHEPSEGVRTYLFACIHNAGRSQMAAALFNLYADGRRCRAISAGTQPDVRVHAVVVEVMQEIGVDLRAAKPQKLTADLAKACSVLVTMGCGEACPFVPGLKTLEWEIPDPKGQPLEIVREIRDDLHEKVTRLIQADCAGCCALSDSQSSSNTRI
jgi:arsenate reductase (thioredoxin)